MNQPPCAPEENVFFLEMGQESPGGVPQQLVVGDHGKTDENAGKETHIVGEDVDVVYGAPALATFGFESQDFNFLRLSEKRTGGTDFV